MMRLRTYGGWAHALATIPIILASSALFAQTPLGNAFTYQRRLSREGNPAATVAEQASGQTVNPTRVLAQSAASGPFSIDTRQESSGPDIVALTGATLTDQRGPFLGLGASYFQAMRRCKYDRTRYESDLTFLASKEFNFIRILSMVGRHPAWEGLEIAPVNFDNEGGAAVAAWDDYWAQFRDCIDIAFDHGLRTEVTIFADAQLMPNKRDRINHMRTMLDNLAGREHKVIMLEVANEAWQNGFPDGQGIADLREFGQYLSSRTDILVALSSPPNSSDAEISELYNGAAADIATVHFSRDLDPADGWEPVYDCYRTGLVGVPPMSSNEPIGPGSSVNSENDPIKLVMAAAVAWGAGLPMYVFHSEAGVFGATTFESRPGVSDYTHLDDLLPPKLTSWARNDGKGAGSPFTTYCAGQPNTWWPEVSGADDGVVRHTGASNGCDFATFPIGILAGGVQLEARRPMTFTVYNPLTGEAADPITLDAGERVTLPRGPGATLIRGRFLDCAD